MNNELNKTCETAILSSKNDYTIFKYGNKTIRFKAPYSLEKYVAVKEWDNGYLVVMTKYKHNHEPEEEYIDLTPILQDLYIDADNFLSPIKEVEIQYE